jgi:Leucine-rich repeat (LRR) protein
LTDIEADFLERQQVEENVYITVTSVMIIKKHILNSLKILELTWHKIKTLENESIVNLSRLQFLGLSNNQLATLSPDSCHHLYSSFITSGDHY